MIGTLHSNCGSRNEQTTIPDQYPRVHLQKSPHTGIRCPWKFNTFPFINHKVVYKPNVCIGRCVQESTVITSKDQLGKHLLDFIILMSILKPPSHFQDKCQHKFPILSEINYSFFRFRIVKENNVERIK